MWNCGRLFSQRNYDLRNHQNWWQAISRRGSDTIDVDLLDVEPARLLRLVMYCYLPKKRGDHGNPLVSGAKVTAEVLEQRKNKKVFAFNTGAPKVITVRSATVANDAYKDPKALI